MIQSAQAPGYPKRYKLQPQSAWAPGHGVFAAAAADAATGMETLHVGSLLLGHGMIDWAEQLQAGDTMA